MENPVRKEQGFTLIETIAVIILVGIISAVLGLAIVQGIKSYVFARSNVSISQKAQLALARMEREFRAITEIDTDSGSSCIRYKRETASEFYRTIGLNGTNLQMNAPDDPGDPVADCTNVTGHTLIDNVENFSLEYENDSNGHPPDVLENLHTIDIELTLGRKDSDRTESFELTVNLRNNGILNAPGSSE